MRGGVHRLRPRRTDTAKLSPPRLTTTALHFGGTQPSSQRVLF